MRRPTGGTGFHGGGGGGGGSCGPLSNVLYLDGGTTVDPGDQDGSQCAPFSTAAAALAAAVALGGATIRATPDDYQTGGTHALADVTVAICSLQDSNSGANFTAGGTVPTVLLDPFQLSGTAALKVASVGISGGVEMADDSALVLVDGSSVGDVVGDEVEGVFAGWVRVIDSEIESAECDDLQCYNAVFTGGGAGFIQVSGVLELFYTKFEATGTIVAPGVTLVCDALTNYYRLTAPVTFAGTIELRGDLPVGAEGAVLFYSNGWKALSFGSDVISGDGPQAPTVADGHTFIVDATALTANRNLTPSVVGATDREAITFVVQVPTSGGGFFYELHADVTIDLDQTMWVDLVLSGGAWVLASWKPITGGF